jgi:hypothetical protein
MRGMARGRGVPAVAHVDSRFDRGGVRPVTFYVYVVEVV